MVAVEVERLITERAETLNKENQQQIAHLQGQIEDLRSAMIRLSNKVKEISEKIEHS
jgi:predicted  nucleic acid-binding Zn-ribbon protein